MINLILIVSFLFIGIAQPAIGIAQPASVWTLSGAIYSGEDPYEGATVKLTNAATQVDIDTTTSDINGLYSFSALVDGTYNLTINAAGHEELIVNDIAVSGADVIQNVVLITTSVTTTISGTVRTFDGLPVDNIEIEVRLYTYGSGDDEAYSLTDVNGEYSITVNSDINAEYDVDLRGGNYAQGEVFPTSITIPTYVSKSLGNITADGSDIVINAVLPEVVTLSGRTTDSDGVAVGNVSIWAYGSSDGFSGQSYDTSTADGSYSLPLFPSANSTVHITPPAGSGFVEIEIDPFDISISSLINFILVKPDTECPVITEYPVTTVSSQGAAMRWRTDELASNIIEYGLGADQLTGIKSRPKLTRRHILRLTGLESDTTYFFRIVSTDAAGNSCGSQVLDFTTDSAT